MDKLSIFTLAFLALSYLVLGFSHIYFRIKTGHWDIKKKNK